MTWFLVDDLHEEAETFANQLSVRGEIQVQPLSASDFIDQLSDPSFETDGLLLDVDLSNEAGMTNTGPGLAQSIRNEQQAQKLASFPIIRFSAPDKVEAFIGSDTSSDDLFDLKIDKAGFTDLNKRNEIRNDLKSTSSVYAAFESGKDLLEVVALNQAAWSLWGHPELLAMIRRVERVYQKALPVISLFASTGLLIDETILAIRLGVDRERSASWPELLAELDGIKFAGVGSDFLDRWWAKALNDWWIEELKAARPLSGSSITERHRVLSQRFGDLTPFDMPPESLGDRPWRICEISKLADNRIVPLDPARSVRFTVGSLGCPWIDPTYAALGPALENRDDPRLSQEDLKKLAHLARRAN